LLTARTQINQRAMELEGLIRQFHQSTPMIVTLANEIRRHATFLGTSICDNFEKLRGIVEIHEALVSKRWMKKSTKARKGILWRLCQTFHKASSRPRSCRQARRQNGRSSPTTRHKIETAQTNRSDLDLLNGLADDLTVGRLDTRLGMPRDFIFLPYINNEDLSSPDRSSYFECTG
jgi:hypothetical protein